MPHPRLWLLAPAAALFALDVTLTLAGQPAAYWAGDAAAALELNPLARPLLVRGPAWFVGAAAAWLSVLAAVIVFWRHPLGAWVAVVLTVGHAVGGSSWLVRWGGWGWAWAVLYLAVAAQASAWCWRRSNAVTASA